MMDEALSKYFQLKAAYQAANQKLTDHRIGLVTDGMALADTFEEPVCQALYEEADRLFKESETLAPYVIRANLKNLGVDDMVVVGEIHHYRILNSEAKRELGRAEMLLSDLCGLRSSGLAERLGITEKVDFNIDVKKEDKDIGWVDCDGRFHFEAAPDVRTALGWAIATDGGRTLIIEFFHLEQAATALIETIRTNGVEEGAFFGPYFDMLRRIFVCHRTTRFGDGCCGVAPTLWRVATRVLFGQEHSGYEYMC